MSLKCLGLKNNDEVITTPYTFYATVNAIVQANCKPIFVDAMDDFNINPDLIEKNHKKTAIVVVHWAGRICEMEKIKKLQNINYISLKTHVSCACKKKRCLCGNFKILVVSVYIH